MAVALHANRLFRSIPNRRCGSETEIKSYGSCLDTRSWSLCRKNRSKYIADIVRGFHQHDNDLSYGAGGDDGSPFHTARETTSEHTYNSNQLKTMSQEDLIAIIMRQNEKEINYKKTINELEELLQTSVNKLKKINSVVTLIHQRIPKTKQQPSSIINRRKSFSHLNLSVSRSTSYLDNYTKTAPTTAEGSTTIKSKIRRQIKSENPRENDEQFIEIERKITKLKVQAAEADELKMTQFALHKMFSDSQKEIKRVIREKKVALNKSAEILAKLMEQLSKQCEQIDVLDSKLRQQIKETETFQKKSMNCENELFKNKKIIAYLCSEIEAMQSELQKSEADKETVIELKSLQKKLDDTMASKSSVFSDATTETDNDQIVVPNQLIPDEIIVENIELEKEVSSLIKIEPIEDEVSHELISMGQEIREEPKESELSIVDLSIEKIVKVDALENGPEVAIKDDPTDVPISLENTSREKSKLSVKKSSSFVNNSMERQSFVKTSKTLIKSKQNEKFDPILEKNLRDQIKSLKSTINNNRNEMNDMRALLKNTKHKLTDQTAKTNHVNQILNEINGLMPDNNVDSDQTLQQQIHNILAKNSDLTNENQELLQQLDQLNSIVEDIETERSKNDEIEKDIKIFERKLSEISTSKLPKSQNNIKSKPSSTSFIKELNSNLTKELEENNRLQLINNQLEEKLKLIEKENDDAVQLSQEMGDEVNQLTEENSKLQNEIKELKNKVQNLNGKIEQLTQKLKATKMDDIAAEKLNESNQFDKLSDDNKKLQSEISELSEKLKTSRMETDKLQNQLNKTNETSEESDGNQLDKLTNENEKLLNEIIELSEKLQTSRMESEKLKNQLDQLKTNNEIAAVDLGDNQNLSDQLKQAQEAKELKKKLDEAECQLNASQPIIPTKDTKESDSIGRRISQIRDLLEKGIQKMEAAHNLELKSVKTKNDNENMRMASLDNLEPIRKNENLNSESLDWLCKRIVNSGIESLNHDELDKLHKDICLAGLKQKSGIFDDIDDNNNKTMTEIEQEMMLKIEHLRAAVNVSQRTLEELRNKKVSKNISPGIRKTAKDFIS